MLINGIEIKINEYKPDPDLALKYFKTLSGKYKSIDRGQEEDKYSSNITLKGDTDNIYALLDEIKINRVNDNHLLTLTEVEDNAKIFGLNIDYTATLTATVINYSFTKQRMLNSQEINLTLRGVDFSFTSSSYLPDLRHLEYGYSAGNTFTVDKPYTYNNSFTYQDMDSDQAIFEGIFKFNLTDAKALLNYIRTQRGNNYTITDIFGVDYPFGKNYSDGYPYTAKLIDWEDLGFIGLNGYRIKLKFAKE